MLLDFLGQYERNIEEKQSVEESGNRVARVHNIPSTITSQSHIYYAYKRLNININFLVSSKTSGSAVPARPREVLGKGVFT